MTIIMSRKTSEAYMWCNRNENFIMYAKCIECKNYLKDVMVCNEEEKLYCQSCNERLGEVQFPVDINKMWSDNLKKNLTHYAKMGLL